MHYEDAVRFGREKPNDAFNHRVYHSELVRGGCELRVTDLAGEDQMELSGRVKYNIRFETEEKVLHAFRVLAANGTAVREPVKPPYMVINAEVRDLFGVHWVLMCDFK